MKEYLTTTIGLVLTMFSFGQVKSAKNGIKNVTSSKTNTQTKLIYKTIKSLPNNTELSIALVNKGKTKFIGVKRLSDTITFTENHNSVFQIGSISKVFTASLLSSFVLDNILDLEDYIQGSKDFKVNTSEKITYKELANHTSGLPRMPSNFDFLSVSEDNPYKKYDSKKLEAFFSENIQLKQKPGTKYEYSNLGFGLLGHIMSQISKSNYEDLLQKKIFGKYGMVNSTSQLNKVKTKIVIGLDKNGNPTCNWDFDVLAGAGAILSTAEDLSKFALAQFDVTNKELVLTQEHTFSVNKKMSVGLGWHILKGKDKSNFIWHNGGTGGYTSSMALDLENHNGIIILSNISAFNKKMRNVDQLCFRLMKTLDEK